MSYIAVRFSSSAAEVVIFIFADQDAASEVVKRSVFCALEDRTRQAENILCRLLVVNTRAFPTFAS